MMSQEEFKQYLDIVVERAFNAGVVWKQNGSELMTMNEAIKQAQKKILECKTNTFNWNSSKFVEKKYENTIDEVCIYTDGNMYAAVSHIKDKCKEFKTKEELQLWIISFVQNETRNIKRKMEEIL